MSFFLEPGYYRARASRWALIKAKTGTPQFAMTFVVLGKLNMQQADGELLACPGVERTLFRSLTERTAPWLLQDLQLLFGYTENRLSPLDPEQADAFDFAGKEFTAVLDYEDRCNPDTGEVLKSGVEKWKFATGQLPGDTLTSAEMKQLDALFGAAKPKRGARKRQPEPVLDDVEIVPSEPVPESSLPV